MGEKRFIIYTDGASRGNPGPAAIGVFIEDEQGRVVATISKAIGSTTNNRAEYFALLAGLEEAARQGADTLDIKLDSQLIVRQLNGSYRSRELGPLYKQTRQLLRKFDSYDIVHIPGSENKVAHGLAKRALSGARN